MDKKGGITFLGSKKFCLTVLKMFVGGTLLSFEKNMVMKRFMHRRGGGGASQFGRIFLSNSTKTSAGRTFVFQKSSGREN